MPDANLLKEVQNRLDKKPLKENLRHLFCETLNWGHPRGITSQPVTLGAPLSRQLTSIPIAQLSGLPVFSIDWPEDRIPTVTTRRALHRALASAHAEHLICYITQDQRQIAFTWARKRPDGKTELRTLPYEVGSPARTTIERLGELAFTLDELGPTGQPPITALTDKLNRAFDVEAVTKKFYQEIANWYFWARDYVVFPIPKGEKNTDAYIAQSLIRLITRLIFCWFMKAKGLITGDLFNPHQLAGLLKNGPKLSTSKETTFYKAILQNLFFATLNQEMDQRAFRKRNKDPRGRDPHRGITNLYRYEDCFTDPKTFLQLVAGIPFLNGGLFECLDKVYRVEENLPDIRIDGFSDHPKNPLSVPDFLFFSEERTVDLSEAYGEKRYKRANVRGLIHTFYHYNFTVTEATPLDQEVALDPELSGKVFENLLAAYNPETATTARKATGSYYTPREIVNYMVDEALLAYLTTKLISDSPSNENKDAVTSEVEKKLRHLFADNEEPHQFSSAEVKFLIDAIDNLRALDPACGSGAFPMGLLHKLVFILGKLDPDNEQWKERQIARVREAISVAERIEDITIRERTLKDLERQIASIEDAFALNELDYGRKLYLIENCIYGVDIQPIAVQIAKMRFFISLLVDQRVDSRAPNLGIRPLPNLETKFVAANTLIGIEKPAQQTLRNPEIDAKEAELKRVRERHFTARTPATKAKYRELDAKLRAEISKLLQKDGFPRETTEKLANWDPYDQNSSADFFDPEWMFGIRDGFHIIIGNPPYIKEYTFRNAFDGLRESPYYKGKMDIWYIFACSGIDLLVENGILSFIAQNNWVTSYGASIMRNKVIQDAQILQMLDFGSYMIFESSDIQTMIMLFKTNSRIDNYKFDYRRLEGNNLTFTDVLDLLNHTITSKTLYLEPNIRRKQFTDRPLTFSNIVIDEILNKILAQSNFKLSEKEVAQGIVAPQDFVIKSHLKKISNVTCGEGIFVLNSEEKISIPFTKKELELIRPFYTTNGLERYYSNRKNIKWIIYTDSKFKNPENIKPYPNIKKHLDKFQRIITSDNKPYGLHRARDEHFFKGEKIIGVRKCSRPTFTYTDFDCYVSATFYVIKTDRIDLKYLNGLLNSRLIAFWLKHKGKMQGNNFQIDKEPLLAIPLIKISDEEQKPIIKLVEQTLTAKQRNPATDSSSMEGEIDELIYRLYGLTDEEIKIVEESVRR